MSHFPSHFVQNYEASHGMLQLRRVEHSRSFHKLYWAAKGIQGAFSFSRFSTKLTRAFERLDAIDPGSTATQEETLACVECAKVLTLPYWCCLVCDGKVSLPQYTVTLHG